MSLIIFEKVNACESINKLAELLISLADSDGNIEGRTRKFNAKEMALNMLAYFNGNISEPNVITREFGFRQQAMYLKYYNKI